MEVNSKRFLAFLVPILALAFLPIVRGQIVERPVDCIKAEREAIIDRFGFIVIRDSYVLENIGNETLDRVAVLIPGNSRNILVSDLLGFHYRFLSLRELMERGAELGTYVIQPIEEDIMVYIFPRYTFDPGERMSFTLTYTLPAKDYVERSEKGYALKLGLHNVTLFQRIEGFYTTITFPEGTSIISSTPGFVQSGTKFEGMKVSGFSAYDPAARSFEPVIIEYDYVLFWVAFYPLLWVSIPLAISYGAMLLPKPRPLVPKPAIPVEKIREFVHNYEEKLSFLTDEEELEDDFAHGKMKRHEYVRRIEEIRRRLAIVERNLAILKDKVKGLGGKYAEIVDEIEVMEVRLSTDKASLRQIEERFRAGQISKSAYSALTSDVLRRTKEGKKAIMEALIRLRREAG